MAIQITEKLLSEKARKFLSKAPSKSQFLRDAIEFYVNSVDPTNTSELCIQGVLMKRLNEKTKELEEIKEIVSSIKNTIASPSFRMVVSDTKNTYVNNNNDTVNKGKQDDDNNDNNNKKVIIPSCYDD